MRFLVLRFKTFLRYKMQLGALKLFYWSQRWSARRAIELKMAACRLLDAEIRLCRASILQSGEDENVDNVVEYVARVLTERPRLSEVDVAVETNSDLASGLLSESRQNVSIQRCVSSYFLADAFFAVRLKDEARSEICLQRAREFDSTAVPLDISAVEKRLKELKRRRSHVYGVLVERSTIKFDISLSDVSSIVGIISVIVFVSGYLYTRYFFGLFGVDVSLFFSLSDYLASSIEQIRAAAFAAAFGLFWFGLAVRRASMRSALEHRAIAAARHRTDYYIKAMALLVIFFAAWTIYNGSPNYWLISAAAVMVSLFVGAWIANIFFTNVLSVTAAASALIVFSLNVTISAHQRADTIRDEIGLAKSNVRVQLKENNVVTKEKGRILGTNSTYIFILQEDGKYIKILPRDQVELFDVSTGN